MFQHLGESALTLTEFCDMLTMFGADLNVCFWPHRG